jgi:hypothetical protein
VATLPPRGAKCLAESLCHLLFSSSLAFLITWRGEMRERPVSKRRAPLDSSVQSQTRNCHCGEHCEQAQRGRGVPIACLPLQALRNAL